MHRRDIFNALSSSATSLPGSQESGPGGFSMRNSNEEDDEEDAEEEGGEGGGKSNTAAKGKKKKGKGRKTRSSDAINPKKYSFLYVTILYVTILYAHPINF
jgi:hypothetical protein